MIEFLAQTPSPGPGTPSMPFTDTAFFEIIKLLLAAIFTGAAAYFVGRKQGREEAEADHWAREHQAELERQARKEEREEEARRHLYDDLRPLVIQLEHLSSAFARWDLRDNIAKEQSQWFSVLLPQVTELSLRRVSGEEILVRLLRDARGAFSNLAHHAHSLSRQPDAHPQADYKYERYTHAQNQVEAVLEKLTDALTGEGPPLR